MKVRHRTYNRGFADCRATFVAHYKVLLRRQRNPLERYNDANELLKDLLPWAKEQAPRCNKRKGGAGRK